MLAKLLIAKQDPCLNLQIVKDWVKQLTSQRGYTDQMVEEANAVLFTFGSYRLGVSVCVAFTVLLYHAYYSLKFLMHQASKSSTVLLLYLCFRLLIS